MKNDNKFPPVPFPQSYWVVPGKLLAGYYPGDLDTMKMEEKLKRTPRGRNQIHNQPHGRE